MQIIDKITDLMQKKQAAPTADHVIYDESIKTLREMLQNGGALPTTMTQHSLPVQTQTQNYNTSGYLFNSQLINETQQDETKEEDSIY